VRLCRRAKEAIALQLGRGASGQSRRNSESSVLSFVTISAIVSAAKAGSASATPAIIRSSVMPDLAAFLPPSLGENETAQANSPQRDVRQLISGPSSSSETLLREKRGRGCGVSRGKGTGGGRAAQSKNATWLSHATP
jgi:hypothetical protein